MSERSNEGAEHDRLAAQAEALVDKRGYSYADAWAEVLAEAGKGRPASPVAATPTPKSPFGNPHINPIRYERPVAPYNEGTDTELDTDANRQPTAAELAAADYAGPGHAAFAAIAVAAARHDHGEAKRLAAQVGDITTELGNRPVQEQLPLDTPVDDRAE